MKEVARAAFHSRAVPGDRPADPKSHTPATPTFYLIEA